MVGGYGRGGMRYENRGIHGERHVEDLGLPSGTHAGNVFQGRKGRRIVYTKYLEGVPRANIAANMVLEETCVPSPRWIYEEVGGRCEGEGRLVTYEAGPDARPIREYEEEVVDVDAGSVVRAILGKGLAADADFREGENIVVGNNGYAYPIDFDCAGKEPFDGGSIYDEVHGFFDRFMEERVANGRIDEIGASIADSFSYESVLQRLEDEEYLDGWMDLDAMEESITAFSTFFGDGRAQG